ncbi:MAG: HPr family phosphocarrier protein [Candidatus Omnitrophica bacterium]|nr:HPr family phosphocarrier protein [Candidatus Omnitrophota bacterium]
MPKRSDQTDSESHMVKKIKVENKLGLHARPAALLVQTISRYESDITVTKGTKKVNAKSIMGVMMLAAGPNSILTFELLGPDAEQAWADIEDLFKRNFDE